MRERVSLPRQAGVNVSYMSDNIQDTWQPHGNGDMMLLAAFTARLTPFNTNAKRWTQFWRWAPSALLKLTSGSPARLEWPSASAPTLWCWKPPHAHEAVVNQVPAPVGD